MSRLPLKKQETTSSVLPVLSQVSDVAQMLGISSKTVHKLVREGKLPCVQVTALERRFTGRLIWSEQLCYDSSVTLWKLFQ
jgi:excisionase family DNA binding protein